MASLGDSITAATLADFPLLRDDIPGLSPEDRVRIWAAEGVSAEFLIENKEKLSWASGHQIQSQVVLLRKYLRRHGDKRRVHVLNTAIPGGQSPTLPEQAEKVAVAMASGDYAALKYVTLLIGANDVCDERFPGGLPLRISREKILSAFKILSGIEQEEPIRILLVGIPRIPDLGRPAIRRARTAFGFTCETVRNRILKDCNPLLLWDNGTEYDQAIRIVDDYNELLRELVTEAQERFPNLEVTYTNQLYETYVTHEMLAQDCFHPNKAAHEDFSLRAWAEQPWFR